MKNKANRTRWEQRIDFLKSIHTSDICADFWNFIIIGFQKKGNWSIPEFFSGRNGDFLWTHTGRLHLHTCSQKRFCFVSHLLQKKALLSRHGNCCKIVNTDAPSTRSSIPHGWLDKQDYRSLLDSKIGAFSFTLTLDTVTSYDLAFWIFERREMDHRSFHVNLKWAFTGMIVLLNQSYFANLQPPTHGGQKVALCQVSKKLAFWGGGN